jgi:hypothetical protein
MNWARIRRNHQAGEASLDLFAGYLPRSFDDAIERRRKGGKLSRTKCARARRNRACDTGRFVSALGRVLID